MDQQEHMEDKTLEGIIRKFDPDLLDKHDLTIEEAIVELNPSLREFPGLGNL